MATLIEENKVKKFLPAVLFKPMKKTDDEFENYTKNGDLAFLLEHMADQSCFQNLL